MNKKNKSISHYSNNKNKSFDFFVARFEIEIDTMNVIIIIYMQSWNSIKLFVGLQAEADIGFVL